MKKYGALSNIIYIILISLMLTGFIYLLVPFVVKDMDHDLEKLETLFKIVALFAAFYFFSYKLITGWLIINLSIKLETERQHKDETTDHLIIHVFLSKGHTDSVWMSDLMVQVSEYEQLFNERNGAGASTLTGRTLVNAVGTDRIALLGDELVPEDSSRSLNISPGEETRFSAYAQVQRSSIVALEVVVFGKRPFYNIQNFTNDPIQWKASLVVLPKQIC